MFMFQRLKAKKGITLVEMVISALILAMALGAMLGCFVIGRISAVKARNRIQVMNFARARMEWVKAQGYTALRNLSPNPFVETDVDAGLIDDTRNTKIEVDADDNLIVTVTIAWQDPIWGGTREVNEKLVTLISEKAGNSY